MFQKTLTVLTTCIGFLAGSASSALALDQTAELRKIVATPYPAGLKLEPTVERFVHNANCVAYYSMRALERGNQLIDDGKYGPAAKRYYEANAHLATKHGYGKWQSAGYVLKRQKELAQFIIGSGFEEVLKNDNNGCSLKYRNRDPKRPPPVLEIIE